MRKRPYYRNVRNRLMNTMKHMAPSLPGNGDSAQADLDRVSVVPPGLFVEKQPHSQALSASGDGEHESEPRLIAAMPKKRGRPHSRGLHAAFPKGLMPQTYCLP